MKMKKRFAICAAASIVIALAGCSSGVKLDREVDINGMTVSVPSGWLEERDVFEVGGGAKTTYDFTNLEEGADNQGFITLTSCDYSLDESIEEAISDAEAFSNFLGEELEVVEDGVIDGAPYTICESVSESNQELTVNHYVFIWDQEMHYEINAFGSGFTIDDLMDTVSIA